jgi:hypothetical protein
VLVVLAAACGESADEEAAPVSRPVLHVTITSADGPLPEGLTLSVKGASGVEGWTVEHEGAVPPDGEVTIEGLAPGEAEAELRGEGFEREVTFYVASDTSTDLLLPVPTGATVEGVLMHKERGPVADARLEVRVTRSSYEDRLRCRVDDAGRFRLTRLPTGAVPVRVSGRGAGFSGRANAALNVPGPGRHEQDLVLGRRALECVVRDPSTGEPLKGLVLSIEGRSFYAIGRTNANGRFRIDDPLPGRARILVIGETWFGRQSATIPEDGNLEVEVEVMARSDLR